LIQKRIRLLEKSFFCKLLIIWFQNDDGIYNLNENKFDRLQDYKLCTGIPVDEDRTCSNSLGTALSVDSHLNYFGVAVNKAGVEYC
jgi:hypothetical protein